MTLNDQVIRLHQEQHGLINQDAFDNAYQHIQHLMHVFAYQHIVDLCVGKSVLDIGCNTGYGTELLAVGAAKIVGVDVSHKAIDIARNLYQSPKVKFEIIDGKHLPFSDNSFDVVVGFQVIEHVVDVDFFLMEAAKVLKPDGVAVFTTPNAAIRLAPGMKPWNKFHVTEYRDHELRNLFEKIFSSVDLFGLAAGNGIDELLKRHYARAMTNSAREEKPSHLMRIIRSVKKTLPDSLVDSLYAKLNVDSRDVVSADFKERYTLNNFYYTQNKLNDALDFLVVASKRKLADIAANPVN